MTLQEQTTVYVLACEGNRFYVGCSKDADKRIDQHFQNQGAEWTQKYKPLKVVEKRNGSFTDETALTKQYMLQYGIDNVRGGPYCSIHLEMSDRAVLQKELYAMQNACFLCGSQEHYAKTCPNKAACARCNMHTHKTTACTTLYCYRCGRLHHTVDGCFAKTHVIPGRSLQNCYRCGRTAHWRLTCKETTDCFGVPLPKETWVSIAKSVFQSLF